MSVARSTPRSPFFSVAYPGWLAEPPGAQQPRCMSSAWIDRVSEQDVRVFSDRRFEVGQPVELCVRLPEENRSLSGVAVVDWVKDASNFPENTGFRWVLGLCLKGNLDAGALNRA
jgi:hypothetical protein